MEIKGAKMMHESHCKKTNSRATLSKHKVTTPRYAMLMPL